MGGPGRRKRSRSSSTEEGELTSSPEGAGNGQSPQPLPEELNAAEEENVRLRDKLRRSELDLENSQKYAASLREHSELLTGKLQEHREALKAARNALAAAAASCSCPHKSDCPKELNRHGSPPASPKQKSPAGIAHDRATESNHPPGQYHMPGVSVVAGNVQSWPMLPASSTGLPMSSHSATGPVEVNTTASLASAAEEGMWQGGFVYDDRSGMYYDHASGYYYDATSRLFYDNNAGIYYTRDPSSGAFVEHHRVDISSLAPASADHEDQDGDDFLPESPASVGGHYEDEDETASSSDSDDSPAPAPCIRAIVLASEKLKVGSLFVVTCDGGTIGRDRDLGHAIRIPELVISKVHAKIEFNSDEGLYMITDYGSRNGTFINGERLSDSLDRSEPHTLVHGDRVQVGSHTHLLCHVHPGSETCNSCEPGQVQAWLAAKRNEDAPSDVKTSYKETLNRLKNRYGLARRHVESEGSVSLVNGSRDRAAARRSAVGVDDPSPSDRPVVSSSTNRPIADDNKGRKLLEKLGWQEGEGLGQTQDGRPTPIALSGQSSSRSGIGFVPTSSLPVGQEKWRQAQARYQKATQPEPVDMFAD